MIALGCDHGGFELKNKIIKHLEEQGVEYKDLGCFSEESVDYPVFALEVARSVAEKKAEFGILCCSTGIGVAIAANKVNGVRAATVCDEFCAEKTRAHNGTNVLCLGGLVVSHEKALKIVDIFLRTPFEGGRHERRVDLISKIEKAEV